MKCPVCDTASGLTFYAKNIIDYVQCPACDLVMVERLPTMEERKLVYQGNWFNNLRRKIFQPIRPFNSYGDFESFREKGRLAFAVVAQHTGLTHGSILDVGCNKGYLLAAAKDEDWEVFGVEFVRELPLPFMRHYKVSRDRIWAGTFANFQTRHADNSFDAVTAVDVIEHLDDPLEEIRNIHRILKPGGVFVIQTPDTDAATSLNPKDSWGALKSNEHYFLFNFENLARLGKRVGFKEVTPTEYFDPADGNFAAVLRK